MDQLDVGIVGCGGAAFDFCNALDTIPNARLVAAYDRNQANAESLAGPRGGKVHASLEALIADPAVGMIYIALPHNLLAEVAEQCLRTGRHVLVEKPMALDDRVARQLGKLADERKLRLGVFFELREAQSVRMAKALLARGAIGEVRAIRIRTIIDKPAAYWQSGPSGRTVDHWRASLTQAGGGVVMMNTIHQIDAVRHITGLNFVRAMGEVATLVASVEVEDAASATLRLCNGGLVNLVASAHSPGARGEERIEIDGTLGRLDLPDPYGGDLVRLYLRQPWEGHPAGEWIDIPAARRDSYAAMVEGFVTAIRAATPAPATSDDAAAAIATVLAIYESSRTGMAVVPRS